eukprot:scaffold23412_cov73-Isochrysis_galbana.AAC.1
MGLGKTAQACSLLRLLSEADGVHGPFLIIAPLSTLPHWRREIESWTRLHAIVFHGGKEAREAMVRYEWAMPPGVGGEAVPEGGGGQAIPAGGDEAVPPLPLPPRRGKYGAPLEWCDDPKFDVCITSYEVLVACAELFRRRALPF